MRKSRSFVRPPPGGAAGGARTPRGTHEGLSSPRGAQGTPRMISPNTLADKNVKAAKLHPGIDALLHPRHPGATPYRVVLGDVRAHSQGLFYKVTPLSPEPYMQLQLHTAPPSCPAEGNKLVRPLAAYSAATPGRRAPPSCVFAWV